jgi:hypothetical protein
MASVDTFCHQFYTIWCQLDPMDVKTCHNYVRCSYVRALAAVRIHIASLTWMRLQSDFDLVQAQLVCPTKLPPLGLTLNGRRDSVGSRVLNHPSKF